MSVSLKPLDQQVVVITGASSGIGLATAELAASRGAKLVLTARSEQTLQEIVQLITAAGGEAIAVAADVADREMLEEVARAAIAHFGRIDTWVNDAGVSIYARLEETPEVEARRLFDTNFWGVVNGCLVALPHLRRAGGALINVGSEVSEAVVPLQGMYAASKHAVKGYTDALRVEVCEVDGAPVSITLIQPGATDTPFPQHARNHMDQEPKLPTPLDDPMDVAEAILEAAVTPMRSKKVSLTAKVNTATAKFAPALGERMAAKQVDRQQYAESPRHPEGTLFSAGESGQVRGSGGVDP